MFLLFISHLVSLWYSVIEVPHRSSGYTTFLLPLSLLSSPKILWNDIDRHCFSFIDDVSNRLMVSFIILKSHHQPEQTQHSCDCFTRTQTLNLSSAPPHMYTLKSAGTYQYDYAWFTLIGHCSYQVIKYVEYYPVLKLVQFCNLISKILSNCNTLFLPGLRLIYLCYTSSLTLLQTPCPSPFYILLILSLSGLEPPLKHFNLGIALPSNSLPHQSAVTLNRKSPNPGVCLLS